MQNNILAKSNQAIIRLNISMIGKNTIVKDFTILQKRLTVIVLRGILAKE